MENSITLVITSGFSSQRASNAESISVLCNFHVSGFFVGYFLECHYGQDHRLLTSPTKPTIDSIALNTAIQITHYSMQSSNSDFTQELVLCFKCFGLHKTRKLCNYFLYLLISVQMQVPLVISLNNCIELMWNKSSSYRLMLDYSVGLWVGIQCAGKLVPEIPGHIRGRQLHLLSIKNHFPVSVQNMKLNNKYEIDS